MSLPLAILGWLLALFWFGMFLIANRAFWRLAKQARSTVDVVKEWLAREADSNG